MTRGKTAPSPKSKRIVWMPGWIAGRAEVWGIGDIGRESSAAEKPNVDSRKPDGYLGIPTSLWNPVNQEAALGKVRPLAIFEPAPSNFS